uniref:Uncharacterized protein n=1 Tax=Arundo donax TaxID=35708 RepID=A0A0A9DJS3_ARUDO
MMILCNVAPAGIIYMIQCRSGAGRCRRDLPDLPLGFHRFLPAKKASRQRVLSSRDQCSLRGVPKCSMGRRNVVMNNLNSLDESVLSLCGRFIII